MGGLEISLKFFVTHGLSGWVDPSKTHPLGNPLGSVICFTLNFLLYFDKNESSCQCVRIIHSIKEKFYRIWNKRM